MADLRPVQLSSVYCGCTPKAACVGEAALGDEQSSSNAGRAGVIGLFRSTNAATVSPVVCCASDALADERSADDDKNDATLDAQVNCLTTSDFEPAEPMTAWPDTDDEEIRWGGYVCTSSPACSSHCGQAGELRPRLERFAADFTYSSCGVGADVNGSSDSFIGARWAAAHASRWPAESEDVEDFGNVSVTGPLDVLWSVQRGRIAISHAEVVTSPHGPFSTPQSASTASQTSSPCAAEISLRKPMSKGDHKDSGETADHTSFEKCACVRTPADDVTSAASSSDGSSSADEEPTTIMLRNLPPCMTQKCLLEEINKSGFAGTFDFCYMPRHFSTGHGKGFAFVNYTSSALATTFIRLWHGSFRFGLTTSDQPISVTYAVLQGLEANVSKWASSRIRRVKNRDLRPYIRAVPRSSSQKLGTESTAVQPKCRKKMPHQRGCDQQSDHVPESLAAEVAVKQDFNGFVFQ
eukprot:TRINITY_DN29060_c0_g1_i1.p1 TRINITY_DN29060_c0_g1~~TRINITY_DN29060_c0_g1_i1.p1  ORF type:complete len:546 (-),score=81.17 TRINITY_DN29060_c0_g1_i1:397-1794(-)